MHQEGPLSKLAKDVGKESNTTILLSNRMDKNINK